MWADDSQSRDLAKILQTTNSKALQSELWFRTDPLMTYLLFRSAFTNHESLALVLTVCNICAWCHFLSAFVFREDNPAGGIAYAKTPALLQSRNNYKCAITKSHTATQITASQGDACNYCYAPKMNFWMYWHHKKESLTRMTQILNSIFLKKVKNKAFDQGELILMNFIRNYDREITISSWD